MLTMSAQHAAVQSVTIVTAVDLAAGVRSGRMATAAVMRLTHAWWHAIVRPSSGLLGDDENDSAASDRTTTLPERSGVRRAP